MLDITFLGTIIAINEFFKYDSVQKNSNRKENSRFPNNLEPVQNLQIK